MPGDVDYAFEKYWASLTSLAEGEGSLAERLIDAYESQGNRAHPVLAGLGPPMSDEIAARIERLHNSLTSKPGVGGGGAIAATVNAMGAVELDAAVSELASVTYALAEEYFQAHASEGP